MSNVATELRCPSCGAPDRTIADAQGMRTCPFCGARYHLGVAAMPPAPVMPIPVSAFAPPAFVHPPPKNQGAFVAGMAFAVLGVLAIAGALVGFLVTSRSASSRSTSPSAAPAVISLPPSPEEETKSVKATATFTAHRIVTSLTTAKYVYGVAQNTSPFTIDKPEIVVVMKDAAGKELKTDRASRSSRPSPRERARPFRSY